MKKMKKGFTIVELVIVIGVIGILSAILIPTFVNLTANAQAARVKSEVSDANTTFVMDAADGYVGEAEDVKAMLNKLDEAFSTDKDYKKGEIVKHESHTYKAKNAIEHGTWDAELWDEVTTPLFNDNEIRIPDLSKIEYHILREGIEYEPDLKNGGWKEVETPLAAPTTFKALSYDVSGTEATYSYEAALYNKCTVIYKLVA